MRMQFSMKVSFERFALFLREVLSDGLPDHLGVIVIPSRTTWKHRSSRFYIWGPGQMNRNRGCTVTISDLHNPPDRFRLLKVVSTPDQWELVKDAWQFCMDRIIKDTDFELQPIAPAAKEAAAETANNPPKRRHRKGGPPPPSDEQKREYIEGWLEADKLGVTQPRYCAVIGIGTSTLRLYMREMEAKDEE